MVNKWDMSLDYIIAIFTCVLVVFFYREIALRSVMLGNNSLKYASFVVVQAAYLLYNIIQKKNKPQHINKSMYVCVCVY